MRGGSAVTRGCVSGGVMITVSHHHHSPLVTSQMSQSMSGRACYQHVQSQPLNNLQTLRHQPLKFICLNQGNQNIQHSSLLQPVEL